MASDAPDTNEQVAPAVQGAPSAEPTAPAPDAEQNPVASVPDRMPTRKDVSLRELLHKIDDYAPIV